LEHLLSGLVSFALLDTQQPLVAECRVQVIRSQFGTNLLVSGTGLRLHEMTDGIWDKAALLQNSLLDGMYRLETPEWQGQMLEQRKGGKHHYETSTASRGIG
jgi:hypothetical protein